ncbi:putative quinol monooxygenase [Rhodoligotrophos defluvii]|uniref:putative quinol monooxygenase n=1 Tax=Rhodoligotrophos defluvii TaxID=2561934 RepID=UPI0010C9BF73|nr:antibiotic biosynthesis monooxygenase [Rhodoligotrophos defluvii]
MKHFAVVVTNHVLPGMGGEYLRIVTPVLDAMRSEPTFINTILNRDPEDPDRFMLFEIWADRAEFLDVQMKRSYRAEYEARLKDILRAPRTMQFWEPLREDYVFFAGPGFDRYGQEPTDR